ncbi:hypothetical protein J2Z47_001721 [Cohnella thailandensis]|nr:hypothetical protein [Cohnella thailandensis]
MDGKKGFALVMLYCFGVLLLVIGSYFLIRYYMGE